MVNVEKSIELQVIAGMLSNNKFFRKAIRLVKPAHFSMAGLRWIFKEMDRYYSTYHQSPDINIIINEMAKLDKDTYSQYEKEILELPSSDDASEYSLDFLMDFVKGRELTKGITEAINYLEKYNIKEAVEVVSASLVDMVDKDWTVDDWASTWEQRKAYFKSRNEETNVLPTGISNSKINLDRVLGGGVRRGEFVAVMAPTKRGKSIFLVHIGYVALIEGWNVLHITLETTKELVLRRYDARFLNTSATKLKVQDFSDEEMKRLNSIIKSYNDISQRLKVVEVPPQSCNINKIFDIVSTLDQTQKFYPDVVIVDYADIMLSIKRYKEFRHEAESIFWDLKRLAERLDVVVWTATQAKALSATKRSLGAEDFSESYGKIKVVDALFAINQTEDEEDVNFMRIGLPAYRDGQCGLEVPVFVDLDKMLFRGIDDNDLEEKNE